MSAIPNETIVPMPAPLPAGALENTENTLLGRLLSLGTAGKLKGEFEQVATLKASDFSVRKNGLVWHAMSMIAARGDKITFQTVYKQLEIPLKDGGGLALDQVGLPHLQMLTQQGSGDLHACALIIRRESFRRKMLSAADTIHKAASNRTLDETQVMGRVTDEVRRLQELHSALDGHPSTSLHTSVGQLWERIEAAQAAQVDGEVTGYGVQMNLRAVDEVTQGFQPEKLYVVAAFSGMGKSSFAVKIGRAALHQRQRVLMIPLEMSHEEMTQRFMAAEAQVNGTLLMTGRVPGKDIPRLMEACQRIREYEESQQFHYLEFRPRPTMAEIDAKITAHMSVHGADIIIFDQLSIEAISGPRADSKPIDYLNAAITRLKAIAKDYHVPVVVMAQLNRGADRDDEMSRLSHFSDSASIYKAADMTIMLHRKKGVEQQYAEDESIVFAKNRSGFEGVKQARYIPSLTDHIDV